ncbi:hypothetical protein [Streptomyces sp. YGL11-2]|uniref:hypothetical protein n=1 Tax=Streptomyces sp. YGL11-2 TaxID=3414028 RepID=UPI003CF7E507
MAGAKVDPAADAAAERLPAAGAKVEPLDRFAGGGVAPADGDGAAGVPPVARAPPHLPQNVAPGADPQPQRGHEAEEAEGVITPP